jgi:hypothetical protein
LQLTRWVRHSRSEAGMSLPQAILASLGFLPGDLLKALASGFIEATFLASTRVVNPCPPRREY